MKSQLRLRHYFTHHQTLGGVQSIIDTHLKLDPTQSLESSLLAFFDPTDTKSARAQVEGLGLKGSDSIRQARHRFSQHESQTTYDIPIFHDLWGLAFLGEFDRIPYRRIGAVHSQWPHLDYQLQQLDGALDGVFCDSQAIVNTVLSHSPRLTPERVRHLPVPTQIAPKQWMKRRSPLVNRPLILGFVGRLDFAQKRVDRFPPLLKHLRDSGIDCELQFLGTGDASQTLPGQFESNAPVHFFGRKTGSEYWEILSKWDFVIYTSDHEGSPLALIEAMSVGNVPIFPRIGSGGDLVVEQISPDLLYEPEQWASVVNILQNYSCRPPDELHQLREACRKLSLTHSQESYHQRFMEFFNQVVELPRISEEFASPRPFFLADYLPMGILKRWTPRSFFNANPLRPAQK